MDGEPIRARERFDAAADIARGMGVGTVLSYGAGPFLFLSSVIHMSTGDMPRARELLAGGLAANRAHGGVTALAGSLPMCAFAELRAGRPAAAAALVAEALGIAEQLGFENDRTACLAVHAGIAALQGLESECRESAERALRHGTANDLGLWTTTARRALAELELGLGNPREALRQIDQLGQTLFPPEALMATPELIDAALQTGERDRAHAALERFADWAEIGRGPLLAGVLARCRAMLAEDDADTERLFAEALAHHAEAPALERARTQLAYGERRAQRRGPNAAAVRARGLRGPRREAVGRARASRAAAHRPRDARAARCAVGVERARAAGRAARRRRALQPRRRGAAPAVAADDRGPARTTRSPSSASPRASSWRRSGSRRRSPATSCGRGWRAPGWRSCSATCGPCAARSCRTRSRGRSGIPSWWWRTASRGERRVRRRTRQPGRAPRAGDGRAVAALERDGREMAALVYDAALDEDPELIETVCAAAGIALENEHLHTESQLRLAELRASRQRIVAAGDAERRRLERNLHDGAQQRLVALALHLRIIQSGIRRDPATAEALVTTASDELAESLSELRELARGIHPAVLDHGLESALTSLAGRSTVPTAVFCEAPEGLPQEVELAAYFVACEALANVAKYAEATTASLRVTPTPEGVAIEIADDGVGGADESRGTGLRGLTDRVEALGGNLLVTSPPGAGTVITAELPV